jgi:hypothetical protein
VVEEPVVHLPEATLSRCGDGGTRGAGGSRMIGDERKVPEDEAEGVGYLGPQTAQHGLDSRAMQALEIRVLNERHASEDRSLGMIISVRGCDEVRFNGNGHPASSNGSVRRAAAIAGSARMRESLVANAVGVSGGSGPATARHLRRRMAVVMALVAGACDSRPPDDAPAVCERDCTLVIDTLWSSDPANPDLSLTYSPVERGDSLVVVNAFENTYLAVLGPAGATVRIVGRQGDGPGDYRSISAIDADPNGQLVVFDRRRLTVLDSALDVVTTTALPVTIEKGIVLEDRTSVVAGPYVVSDTLYTLHLLGPDGALLESFDPSTGSEGRFIARGRDTTVWAAPMAEEIPVYELHRWNPRTGQLLQSIRDSPPWFRWKPPEPSAATRACDRGDRAACERAHDEPKTPHPPPPRIFHMWESPDGLLWVMSFKADARWKDAAMDDRHRRFDSVLEVRNALTGRLVMERTFDQYLTGFTNEGHIMMFELDKLDRPVHTLISVALRRSTRANRE